MLVMLESGIRYRNAGSEARLLDALDREAGGRHEGFFFFKQKTAYDI